MTDYAIKDANDATQTVTVPTLGQKSSTGSIPMVLSSEQQAILQALVTALQAALPLPVGAATEATLAAQSAKLPATLGQKTGANSLAMVPASDVLAPTKYPNSTSAVITSVQTAATGTNWTAFASLACTALSVNNNTTTALEFRRGGAGLTFPIQDGAQYIITGITNASQIEFRRIDTSNTQVTLKAEGLN